MSQLKNKFISIIIICTMFCAILPCTAFAQGNTTVYLTVENQTLSTGNGAPWEGKLLDNVEIEITEGETKIVDVIVEGLENGGYTQTGADMGYISEINGLDEFCGAQSAGWMVTLNDWFINSGIDSFYVSDEDRISVMFTSEGYGEDIGSSWNNNNKQLSAVDFSAGVLKEEFSPDVYEYTLTIPADTEAITVTPYAENKNFQTRNYLNAEFYEGEYGKYIQGEEELESVICGLDIPSEIPENIGYYKRTQEIPVQDGDIISIACGLPYWNSMNNGDLGSGAEEIPGTVYTFAIETENEEISIGAGIYDYTALTYKENNSECDIVVSEDGLVYETQDFNVAEGTTVLDALITIFENEHIAYSINEQGNYISSVGGLSEMECGYQSGWMVSVNDEFLSVGAGEAVLSDGDTIKLHYSVEGWGTDVGNYFTGGPVLKKIVLGGTETIISSNTVYADENDFVGTTTYYLGEYREGKKNVVVNGEGTEQSPFIIPVKVGSRVDITALTAQIKTSLNSHYLYMGEGEGLTDILSETNYENDVTFSIETPGGFFKNYYTLKVTKKVSTGSSSGGGIHKEEPEKEQEADPVEKEEVSVIKSSFNDVGGHWAEEYINTLAAMNIINGKTENSFAPEDNITRAEIITLLFRLSGAQGEYSASEFTDVNDDDWYKDAVAWSKEKGIANGVSESEFNPLTPVTREQIAVFIVRFCDYMNYNLAESNDTTELEDVSQVSSWAFDSIEKAVKAGIINGFEDGTLLPAYTATRAQVAKMLCTVIKGLVE